MPDGAAKEREEGSRAGGEGERLYRLTSRLAGLYVSYRGKYTVSAKNGRTYIVKRNGEYVRLTNKTICGHLSRYYAIGVFAGPQASKFLCFDIDEGGIEVARRL